MQRNALPFQEFDIYGAGFRMIVFATVVASGVRYVWLWGCKAIAERKPH